MPIHMFSHKHKEKQQNHVKCQISHAYHQILPRNDIEVIAVKANCTFIGFEDSSFNGAQVKLPAKPYDRLLDLFKIVLSA